jgi:hypothetical protein
MDVYTQSSQKDVYTQSSQKQFSLSGIIKLVYDCIQWELNVSVNM